MLSKKIPIIALLIIGFSFLFGTGATFALTYTTKTTAHGLGAPQVRGIYVSGSNVYAATEGGLSISTDGGNTFSNKTTAHGLGSNMVRGVHESGGVIYAATDGGLSISTNGGITFTNKTMMNGLVTNTVYGAYASGSNVYAATLEGVAISTNGGNTFINKTTVNGLGSNIVLGIYVSGSNVYAATAMGLSISTDGGVTFINKTTANGLGSSNVYGVYVSGSNVYAATVAGLSISTDGGVTFSNKTTANGLGNNTVYGVYADGSNVYAAVNGGLSISTDGGNTFINDDIVKGLPSNLVYGVYASGSNVYAATGGGVSIASTLPIPTATIATNTPTTSGRTYIVRTTANGLGNNSVYKVYADGNTIYAATLGGLSISTDGGNTFSNKTIANGLGSNDVPAVYVSGNNVYAATWGGGLSISTDGGNSFMTKTIANGLGSNSVGGVYVNNTTIYAATGGGLSISTNGGITFTNKTTAQGLGHSRVNGVYVSGSNIYAATHGGLSISTNGGLTFTNKITTSGLGHNTVYGVYANGNMVYASTQNGLSISTDGGNTFSNKTMVNGLGNYTVHEVYVSGNMVLAATNGGMSISTDGGNIFTNDTVNSASGVYMNGGNIYVATSGFGLLIGGVLPTPTPTATSTDTPTSTATPTATPTSTSTPTATSTDTPTSTATPTDTPTSTPTPSPTPDITPGVILNLPNRNTCLYEPQWLTVTGLVQLPSIITAAQLRTTWQVNLPTDSLYHEPVRQYYGWVSHGYSFTTQIYWPGIRPNEGSRVETVLRVRLYDAGSQLVAGQVYTEGLGNLSTGWTPSLCPRPAQVQTGNLIGTVTRQKDNTPVTTATIQIYRLYEGGWLFLTNTQTLSNGMYLMPNLAPDSYKVSFQSSGVQMEQAEIQITPSQTTTLNVTLKEATPPIVNGATTCGAPITFDALGHIHIGATNNTLTSQGCEVTITSEATCETGEPTDVTLNMQRDSFGRPTKSYAMTKVGSRYQATIPRADLPSLVNQVTETYPLAVSWNCGNTPKIKEVGAITLYDPSGLVIDAQTRQPISQATVTLYKVNGWLPRQSKDDTETESSCETMNTRNTTWSQIAPVGQGEMVNATLNVSPIISPTINPQITGGDGYYGWDVAEGCWYITVTASGYEPKTSFVVGVPPEVTDLNIALQPLAVVRIERTYLPLVIKK